MIEWLQFLYAICTSTAAPANWREITIVANVAIALAYLWIPVVMAVVFIRWRQELPFRWLWAGFVVFIVACALSHAVHAGHAITARTPHNWLALSILIGTALVSLVTAGLFTVLLPKILRFASPGETKQRLEQAVAMATEDLQKALRHERVLLREVHHRVKNNLQVTASLVSLHMRRSSGSTAELKALRDRISAMASIHAQFQDVGSAALRAKPFVENLALSLTNASGREGVGLEIGGDDFEVPLDHAAAFALIVHEAIANALNHAFADGRSGSVTVVLENQDGWRRVTVSDDGVGFAGNGRRGIGETLIRTLAVQLDAQIEWTSEIGEGTIFRMRFAEHKPVDRLPPP